MFVGEAISPILHFLLANKMTDETWNGARDRDGYSQEAKEYIRQDVTKTVS